MSGPRALALFTLIVAGAVVAWVQVGRDPSPRTEGRAPVASEVAHTQPRIEAADLPVLRPAPDLVELDGWLQTEADALDDFDGKVLVLQFWTFSCRNCKATIPALQEIYSAYGRDQVEIVGVHAPEFSFEEDPDAILTAATELGVGWPIALDTAKRNFHAWQEGRTAYWPRTYVIDSHGQIRFDHIGEGKYEELRDAVAALVAEL